MCAVAKTDPAALGYKNLPILPTVTLPAYPSNTAVQALALTLVLIAQSALSMPLVLPRALPPPKLRASLNLDDPLDVLTIQLGTYAGYEIGDLGFEAYAGIGYNDFESERKINVGDFTGSADGDWTGTHYNASLRAGYDMEFGEKFFIRPFCFSGLSVAV